LSWLAVGVDCWATMIRSRKLLVTCSKICCDRAICVSIFFCTCSNNVLNLSSLSLCAFWLFSDFRIGVSKKWSTIARCCSTFVFPGRLYSAQMAWACLLSRLRTHFRLQGWNCEASYSALLVENFKNYCLLKLKFHRNFFFFVAKHFLMSYVWHLFMGLTMQPCAQSRCFIARILFYFIDFVYAINIKINFTFEFLMIC